MPYGPEITDEDLLAFKRDGFLLKKAMYAQEEVALLRDIAKGEQSGFRFGTGRGRGQGAEQQLNALGEPRKSEIYHFEKHGQALASPSIYDAILFGERMIKAIERLILDPDEPRHSGKYKAVTLHHRKFTMKDAESFLPPAEETKLKEEGNWQGAKEGYFDASTGEKHLGQHSGNRWQWHQDYGYWYGAHGEGGDPGVGGPFPDMCIAGIAIDRAHKGNGCLQMMRGSHKMGRLDSHQEEWGERHIHPRRIELAIKAGCEPVFCEQEPGDCLFFHCNMIHQSFPNNSMDEPRWCFLNAFDSVHNAQFYKKQSAPAPMVPDHCVLQWGRLHKSLMEECGGDLKLTLRRLKDHSDMVELVPGTHAVDVGENPNNPFLAENWDDMKKKLYTTEPTAKSQPAKL